jgi:hypothetical protein
MFCRNIEFNKLHHTPQVLEGPRVLKGRIVSSSSGDAKAMSSYLYGLFALSFAGINLPKIRLNQVWRGSGSWVNQVQF